MIRVELPLLLIAISGVIAAFEPSYRLRMFAGALFALGFALLLLLIAY